MTIRVYKPNDTARIEAMLFDDDLTTLDAAVAWAKEELTTSVIIKDPRTGYSSLRHGWHVKTLEGWVDMPYGSYLAKGTNGEFYPIHPDVMAKRWVEVSDG